MAAGQKKRWAEFHEKEKAEKKAVTVVRPKLFLDTNIFINAANGNIAPGEWNRVRKYIRKKFRHHISFITLKELFSKVVKGGVRDSHRGGGKGDHLCSS